jgi:transposase
MNSFHLLTDAEWELLAPLFPTPAKRSRGKPHTPWRNVVNAILFVLETKSKWGQIPEEPQVFAAKSAAHRWFAEWDKTGTLNEIKTRLASRFTNPSTLYTPPRRDRKPMNRAPAETPTLGALLA